MQQDIQPHDAWLLRDLNEHPVLTGVARKIPNDWSKLAIFLGLPEETIASIRGKVRTPADWAEDMLSMWYANKPSLEDLIQALTEIHRMDLVNLCNFPEQVHSNIERAKIFRKLAEKIPNAWRDLGISLGISMDDLDNISRTQANDDQCKTFRVLKAWICGVGVNCTVKQLKEVLDKDMKRRDVVTFIDNKLRNQQPRPVGIPRGNVLNDSQEQFYYSQPNASVIPQQAMDDGREERNGCLGTDLRNPHGQSFPLQPNASVSHQQQMNEQMNSTGYVLSNPYLNQQQESGRQLAAPRSDNIDSVTFNSMNQSMNPSFDKRQLTGPECSVNTMSEDIIVNLTRTTGTLNLN